MDDDEKIFPVSFRELAPVKVNGNKVSPPVIYHSLFANWGPPNGQKPYNEWVVFHSEYTYPEYVIAYQRWNGNKGPV